MTSVLVVSASPDRRTSTTRLRELVEEIADRPGTSVDVWFLRVAWDETPWPGSRVVDDLRTWFPSRVARALGAEKVSAALQGARLRLWHSRVRPDVVLLDDGLGERVLERVPGDPRRILRLNAELPADATLERPATRFDAVVAHPSRLAEVPEGVPAIAVSTQSRNRSLTVDYADPELYRELRRTLELPVDEPLVVGWGEDGWLDGPDLFVRSLWFLEHRHGILAHGVWFGFAEDEHEQDRIRQEAHRCGAAERFHLRPAHPQAAIVGDVNFLPYRASEETEEQMDLVDLAATGAAVVTFPLFESADPSITVVDHLDVAAAAEAMAGYLAQGRASRAADARRRLDVRGVADFVLGVVSSSS